MVELVTLVIRAIFFKHFKTPPTATTTRNTSKINNLTSNQHNNENNQMSNTMKNQQLNHLFEGETVVGWLLKTLEIENTIIYIINSKTLVQRFNAYMLI